MRARCPPVRTEKVAQICGYW